jgi:hypothetical protein
MDELAALAAQVRAGDKRPHLDAFLEANNEVNEGLRELRTFLEDPTAPDEDRDIASPVSNYPASIAKIGPNNAVPILMAYPEQRVPPTRPQADRAVSSNSVSNNRGNQTKGPISSQKTTTVGLSNVSSGKLPVPAAKGPATRVSRPSPDICPLPNCGRQMSNDRGLFFCQMHGPDPLSKGPMHLEPVCENPKCRNAALFNFPDLNRAYCEQHKTDKMVQLSGQQCNAPYCLRSAQIIENNVVKLVFCPFHRHKAQYKCRAVSCVTPSLFGKLPSYFDRACAAHKVAGMRVLPGMTLRTCLIEGCFLPAIYRTKEGGYELCGAHREDGMIRRGGMDEAVLGSLLTK